MGRGRGHQVVTELGDRLAGVGGSREGWGSGAFWPGHVERPGQGPPPGETTKGDELPSRVGPSVPGVCVVHHRASPSPPRAQSVSKETLFICPRHTNWYLKAITLFQACSITLYVLTHFHPQMNPRRIALSLCPFYKQGEPRHRGWIHCLPFQSSKGQSQDSTQSRPPERTFSPWHRFLQWASQASTHRAVPCPVPAVRTRNVSRPASRPRGRMHPPTPTPGTHAPGSLLCLSFFNPLPWRRRERRP